MKIGLASPNSSHGVPTAELAFDAEQRGYDSLWVGEHSHIPASRETPHPSGIDLPTLYWHMRETVTALRSLWTSEEAGFSGEHVNFAPSWVYPKPAQADGPPILLGCQGRVGLRHVAEYADEWCPIDVGFRDVDQGIEWFREAVVKAGRDPNDVAISMYCFGG